MLKFFNEAETMNLVELVEIASSEEKAEEFLRAKGVLKILERILKFHGVRMENFVYYLKELEFRYNNRENLDEMMYLCLGRIK